MDNNQINIIDCYCEFKSGKNQFPFKFDTTAREGLSTYDLNNSQMYIRRALRHLKKEANPTNLKSIKFIKIAIRCQI